MKKILITALLMITSWHLQAQNYTVFKEITQKINPNLTTNKSYDKFDLNGKMYIAMRDSIDHSERVVIDFQPENKIAYVEVFFDKNTGATSTNTFTGDVVRRGNALSVRADRLNGKLISPAVVYNFLLIEKDHQYYLVDIKTREKWVPTDYLEERTALYEQNLKKQPQ